MLVQQRSRINRVFSWVQRLLLMPHSLQWIFVYRYNLYMLVQQRARLFKFLSQCMAWLHHMCFVQQQLLLVRRQLQKLYFYLWYWYQIFSLFNNSRFHMSSMWNRHLSRYIFSFGYVMQIVHRYVWYWY